jgi:hypothetical protein
MKSGNLNFLEPCGPLQACNGLKKIYIYIYKDDIKIKFKKTGREGLKWIDLVEDRYKWPALVNSMMNIGVPYNEGNLLSSR